MSRLAVQTAANASTVTKTYTPRSVPGFTPECRDAIDEVKRTKRVWERDFSSEHDLAEYIRAKRERKKAIARAQRDLYRDKASKVKDEIGLWLLAKWT
ncbi:uncharacterized protein RCO7_02603 [Rhynchosporium graminicola]|uniref:Uncharacterized protein n=1 Tax=Rhynchosporium graminicola TaxID=2792576 RepID=A0A1E1KFL7_9HELO|nr:uncharacterized protein RCO7_02603 [Rhynchosporium commune]